MWLFSVLISRTLIEGIHSVHNRMMWQGSSDPNQTIHKQRLLPFQENLVKTWHFLAPAIHLKEPAANRNPELAEPIVPQTPHLGLEQ